MTTFLTSGKFRVPLLDRKAWQRYSIALLSVIGFSVARWFLQGYPDLSPFILFYPAVMFAAWYGGFGPGLLSTFLSMAVANFFFMEPYYSFRLRGSDDFLNIILFAAVSVVICTLTENLRRAIMVKNQGALDLLKAQKRVVDILESIQGCFFSVDSEAKIVHVNDVCHKYITDAPEDLLGMDIWRAFPEWKETLFAEKFEEAMRERHTVRFEFFDEKRSRWNDIHISPTSEGLSIHFFDVSSRKDAEYRLRLLVDSDLVGVIFGNPDGVIHFANDVFLRMVGYSREELERGALNEFEMTPKEYEEIDKAKWDECLESKKCEPWEKEFFRKDGGRVPVLLAMTFLGHSGREWACFVADLTEHKAQQRRLATESEVTKILAVNASLASAMPNILEKICFGLKRPLGIFWEFVPNFDVLRFGQAWTEDPGNIPLSSSVARS